ncbi:hypothetical protein AV650_19460 [Serratia fonticola]|nr:hypothetical protein AV650_19460 [Serratia fonticola]
MVLVILMILAYIATLYDGIYRQLSEIIINVEHIYGSQNNFWRTINAQGACDERFRVALMLKDSP